LVARIWRTENMQEFSGGSFEQIESTPR